eukprot:TRINITY_DN82806_c0_g1_i1.p1 TRINITY_DN82806_c0_g1~~TRINITY_DN82806_c0_g1_i1.p1  ORF type:complete len:702 (-),score=222.08 TRINITY_DN82806_c0_g1_i1:62-2167(-)
MSTRLMGEIFRDLHAAVEAEDNARCLTFAQEILAQEPNDVDALHCALVAQIHLSKYEDVVKTANSVKDEEIRDGFRFEHAYALYRLSRFEEALKVLSPLEMQYDPKAMDAEGKKGFEKENIVPSVLLRAQILFKLGDFKSCVATLSSTLPQWEATISWETQCDFLAALCLSGTHPSTLDDRVLAFFRAKNPEEEDEIGFEFYLNQALIEWEMGNTEQAENLLEIGKSVGETVLKAEGLSKEEIENELAVMELAEAFVLHASMKSLDRARSIYESILSRDSLEDSNLRIIARNNIIPLQETEKSLISHARKFKVEYRDVQWPRLSKRQQLILRSNQAQMFLRNGKVEQTQEILKEMESIVTEENDPDAEIVILLKAALAFRQRKYQECEEILVHHIGARDTDTNVQLHRVHLALVQLLFVQKKYQECWKQMDDMIPFCYEPAVVGWVLRLSELMKDTSVAMEILEASAAFWEGEMSASERAAGKYAAVLRACGEWKMKNGMHEDAAEYLEKLFIFEKERGEVSDRTVALLVLNLAHVDTSKAEEIANLLPEQAQDKDEIDISALEEYHRENVNHDEKKIHAEATKTPLSKDVESGKSESAKPKPHRRAIHVPKNMDTDSKPDPERWLPLKERSYYRKGRKPTKGGVKAQVFATVSSSATGDGKGLRAVPPPMDEAGSQKAQPYKPKGKDKSKKKKGKKGKKR